MRRAKSGCISNWSCSAVAQRNTIERASWVAVLLTGWKMVSVAGGESYQ